MSRRLLISNGFVGVLNLGYRPDFHLLIKHYKEKDITFVDRPQVFRKFWVKGKVLVTGNPHYRLDSIWVAQNRFRGLTEFLLLLREKHVAFSKNSNWLEKIAEQSNVGFTVAIGKRRFVKRPGVSLEKTGSGIPRVVGRKNRTTIHEDGSSSAKTPPPEGVIWISSTSLLNFPKNQELTSLRAFIEQNERALRFKVLLDQNTLIALDDSSNPSTFFLNLVRFGYRVFEDPGG